MHGMALFAFLKTQLGLNVDYLALKAETTEQDQTSIDSLLLSIKSWTGDACS